MIFSSIPFLFVYLPIVLLGFSLTSYLGRHVAGIWLVLSSIVFYGCWRLSFVPILLLSIVFNYLLGIMLFRSESRPRLQLSILAAAILLNISLLFYFKYAVTLAIFLGFESVAGQQFYDVILPLGISFFTFTQIGYLIDVKQGVVKVRDPLSYILFVTFFPHLIAGPMLHNREMMPQFARRAADKINGIDFAIGLTIFCIGLAKKVIFADPFAAEVGHSFAHPEILGTLTAWHAVISYSFQLYFDFSGYSDMAVGLARMINIRFPMNFNSPYRATTFVDYWQRFHMTLTRFITMYIFSPIALSITRWRNLHGLDNSRRASAKPGGFLSLVVGPTIITMGLAGVWHGAGWQYLIFGLLHGIYITVNHAARIFFPPAKPAPIHSLFIKILLHSIKVLAVYVAALVAFVFFRAGSVNEAFEILSSMIGMHGMGEAISQTTLVQLTMFFLIVWFVPNTQQIMTRYEPGLGKSIANPYKILTWAPTRNWAVVAGGVAALSVLALSGTTEFLYFQF